MVFIICNFPLLDISRAAVMSGKLSALQLLVLVIVTLQLKCYYAKYFLAEIPEKISHSRGFANKALKAAHLEPDDEPGASIEHEHMVNNFLIFLFHI